MWDKVISTTPEGVLKEIDAAMLFGMCKWWSVWRKLDRSLSQKMCPATITSATKAWNAFNTAAIQYGMTPAARSRLQIEQGHSSKDTRNSELIKKYLV